MRACAFFYFILILSFCCLFRSSDVFVLVAPHLCPIIVPLIPVANQKGVCQSLPPFLLPVHVNVISCLRYFYFPFHFYSSLIHFIPFSLLFFFFFAFPFVLLCLYFLSSSFVFVDSLSRSKKGVLFSPSSLKRMTYDHGSQHSPAELHHHT